MILPNPGTLAAYNSLTDRHLTGYFSNTRIRRHLQKVGLITRHGRIVPDKEYRHNIMRRDHQKYVRECLAQAIFHKVLDMEVDRSKRYDEDFPFLSPRPPTAPKNGNAGHSGPEAGQSESSEPLDREARRHITSTDFASGISPYRLPVINNYVTPVPPPHQKRDRSFKGASNGTRRGRKLRPTTAPNGIEETKDSAKFHKTSVHSNVAVTMMYFGKSIHLSHDDTDFRDEVKVYQQHCGGENLCVYKGELAEGETFQFVSRRHHGFPFSLTFFLNTMQVDRLSSCCEFKHCKGARLGGKQGHFGIVSVEGASPCYRCIIAVGLDKKPTPLPKRIKKEVEKEESSRDQGKEDKSCSDEEMLKEESRANSSLKSPHNEEDVEEENPMELEPKEENEIPGLDDEKLKDEYDDDFEVDEVKPDAKEENKKEADMNGRSSTSSDDERGNSDTEETEYKEKEEHHSGSDDDRASYSDSEEEDSKQGDRRARSSGSSSSSYSSSSSRKDSESDREGAKDGVKKEEIKATSSSVSNTEPRRESEAANDVEDQVKNEEAESDTNKEQHTHEEAKQREGAENAESSDQVSTEYQQTGEVERESAALTASERNEAVEQTDSMERPGSAKDEDGITDSKPEAQTETAVFAEPAEDEKQGSGKYAGSSEL
ncbi:UNVERIFIED_CONTAM: hypothetical protein FKN15_048050 [Acipenser sinensis]